MMPPRDTNTSPTCPQCSPEEPKVADIANPADLGESELLRDQIDGVTTEHAMPPRLEDEGQSGG